MSELTIQPSQEDHQTLTLAEALRPLAGRRLERLLAESRTTWHFDHKPGQVVEMARGRRYYVAKDGSYRRFSR